MKNLLRLIVVALVFQSTQAIGVLRLDELRLERELREVEDAFAAQEKALRERYAAIKLAGGVVKGNPGKQSIGCETPEAFIKHMAFVLHGKGSPPHSDRCWPLKDGTKVEIKMQFGTSDGGIGISYGCTKKFDICWFDPGWFGKNFYTHINLIEPIK